MHYFGDMKRGFDFYCLGIKRRGENLMKSYCLYSDMFAGNEESIVIDCGANYADLSIPLRNYINLSNYITFEPGLVEFECIKKNAPEGTHFNKGLFNIGGVTNFYVKSATGDSSLIEIEDFTEKVSVEVITLDNFAVSYNLKTCTLLKLEAEGLEPEILAGAKNFLKLCKYVAVDGGCERGLEQSMTLPAANTVLTDNGFELIDLNTETLRALYKKR